MYATCSRRHRWFPQEAYEAAAADYPLMLTRVDLADPRLGETLDALDPLERLLRCVHSVS
jgi:hypothetical protein